MKDKNQLNSRVLFRYFLGSLQSLMVCEAQLIQKEVRRSAQLTGRRSFFMAFSLVFVGIGVLLGVTSLVVALSPWVGGSIAWSALILCGMFLSFGLLSLRYFSREVISPKLSFSPFWESLRSIFQNQVEGDSALKSSSELRVVSSQQPAEGKQERQAS